MKIEVTQKDIENGQTAHCFSCPVALAATRAFGRTMAVTAQEVMDYFSIQGRKYQLPDEARNWILNFDSRGNVVPFSFEV